MDTLTNIRFELWADTAKCRDYVTFRADVKDVDPNVSTNESGLKYIWFVMTAQEFRDFARGKGNFTDGYYQLSQCGEFVTICKFEQDFRKSRGVLKVPYLTFNMPYFVRRVLLKKFEQMWKVIPRDNTKVDVNVSAEKISRWLELYGQGKGDVEVIQSEATREFYTECGIIDALSNDGETVNTLAYRLKQVKRIAGNSTYSFFETAKVKLYKDCDGFYWEAVNSRGSRIMNGGIINHGTEAKPDWSIHT